MRRSAMRSGNWSMFSGATQAAVKQLRAEEAAALQPRLPMPPPFDPLTLPLMQQAALMQASESHWKRTVVRLMLEDSQDKPATSDYVALAELGLAYKKRNEKWHSLTGEGTAAARTLEPMLCKQLDIHDMLGPRGDGPTVRFSCPCGWKADVRNSNTARGNAAQSFRRHHTTAAAIDDLVRALKPPVMAAEG